MRLFWIAGLLFLTLGASAQQPSSAPAGTTPPIERRDPALDAASDLIGRALFLRCFCAENNLQFDPQGKVEGQGKTVDWTLAAVNVQKAERKSPGIIELDGVRVAIRYAPDRREFDRHPLNDEKIKIQIADTGDEAAFLHALPVIFSTGIDRSLQRSMPGFWQHYFAPQEEWQDDLKGQTLYAPGSPATPPGLTSPVQTHKADAGYTSQATHDHVQGTLEVRLVVDTSGTPRRITIVQPLGYGLDARAAEAIEKFRFSPGTLDGNPVAEPLLIKQEFALVPVPGP